MSFITELEGPGMDKDTFCTGGVCGDWLLSSAPASGERACAMEELSLVPPPVAMSCGVRITGTVD